MIRMVTSSRLRDRYDQRASVVHRLVLVPGAQGHGQARIPWESWFAADSGKAQNVEPGIT